VTVLARALAIALIGAFLAGCSGRPQSIRIAVMKSGEVRADGAATTLSELDRRLAILARDHGVVRYYREDGESSPLPRQDQAILGVLNLVIQHKLPVQLSSKADFSDTVDLSGQARNSR
jgi:hypothetical protein